MSSEKLHEDRHVCGDHLERRDFGKTGKRLKKRAFPKLHLSSPPLSDHQMREFPQHVASKQVLAANQNIPAESLPVGCPTVKSTPSTSRTPLATLMPPNINEPIPAKHPRLENEFLGSRSGPIAEPQKTEQSNQNAEQIPVAIASTSGSALPSRNVPRKDDGGERVEGDPGRRPQPRPQRVHGLGVLAAPPQPEPIVPYPLLPLCLSSGTR